MAKSKLKLTYFDLRGLGESPRLILAYAGKDYEEVRVKIDQWAAMKPTVKPLNQLPLLEVDGQVICQSLAIRGFLAREFGLSGKNNEDSLTIDTVTGTVMDMFKEHAKWYYLPDGPEKEEGRKKARQENARCMAYLESLLAKSGTDYFTGNSLTLADVLMFDALTGYSRLSIDFSEEKYPRITKNKAKVLENANIAAYVAKRPDSEF